MTHSCTYHGSSPFSTIADAFFWKQHICCQKMWDNWAVFFLVVWGVYTGRTCLRHAYAVGFYQGFGLRGV